MVSTPLKNVIINWDDYYQYMGKSKMFQTTNQIAVKAVNKGITTMEHGKLKAKIRDHLHVSREMKCINPTKLELGSWANPK